MSDNQGLSAHSAAQNRATRATPRACKSSLGHSASVSLRDALLDDGTDTFNRYCTRIAIVMLGGMLAIYLETFHG